MTNGTEVKPREQSQLAPTSIGVLICSYGRAADLLRCLDAIERQTRKPDDLIVVVHVTDGQTQAALATRKSSLLPVRLVLIHEPGLVAARNKGLDHATTDIIAMIDDDTVPSPAWLSIIFRNFAADSTIGGLGGRDRTYYRGCFNDDKAEVVGKVQWFGRVIGNHHIGTGPSREVDVLKGANMSYRAEAIGSTRFDTRLKGAGSQPNDDMAFSLAIKRKGWKNVFDPEAAVEHYVRDNPAGRPYGGVDRLTNVNSFRDFSYNEVLALWDTLSPVQRGIFVLWSLLVGTGVCPGIAQVLRYLPTLKFDSFRRFLIAQQGKFSAVFDLTFAPAVRAARAD